MAASCGSCRACQTRSDTFSIFENRQVAQNSLPMTIGPTWLSSTCRTFRHKSCHPTNIISQFSRFLILIGVLYFKTPMTQATQATTTLTSPSNAGNKLKKDATTLMVFSDLDGTLIHYPDSIPDDNESLLKLPPSSTGMRGIVSSQTLKLTQELRRQGKKFVLISGMRTTTLLNRLPYLPKADAYCSEAGGRIFYPTDQMNEACFTIEPKSFQGATKEDLKPFGIVEDMDWRKQLEEYTGKFDMDGSSFQNIKSFVSTPVEDRASSKLWNYARDLQKKGYVIDIKGYSSCFRLNKKHQVDMSNDDFYSLIDKEALKQAGLATSVNLSCIDIYPAISGKKNCCQYLGEKFFPDVPKADILPKNSVCLCDDDNDIEMASAVRHAFIPSLHSKTMEEVIQKHQDHFTETYKQDSTGSGTGASDLALRLILEGAQ